MLDIFVWAKDVLGQWVSDANRIASENWAFTVVMLAVVVAFVIYPAGRGFWFWALFAWYRVTHWGRSTVSNQIADYRARKFLADGVVNLVNYMWLTKMISKKKRDRVYRKLAFALSEPGFLPDKDETKPLPKGALDQHKKLSRERREEGVGPVGQLPGDKPIQDPKTATAKSVRKGKVVVV